MIRILKLHPLLFALYPALFLLSNNIEEFPPESAAMPLLGSAAGALVLWAVIGALLGDRVNGGILTSFACLLFFGHGVLRDLTGPAALAVGLSPGTAEGVLVLSELGVYAAAFVGIRRAEGSLGVLNRVLGVASLVLFLQPLSMLALNEWSLRAKEFQDGPASSPKTSSDESGIDLANAPDIYFLVLDGYGRADVLRDTYGVDNSDLRDYLESVGFYVAAEARANYAQTSLALAAALNMAYVENLKPRPRTERMLYRAIRNNKAFARLRRLGYSLIAFASASQRAEMRDPDVFYDSQTLDDFQTGLLASTPIPFVARWLAQGAPSSLDPYELHRKGILYTLEKLPRIRGGDTPHIVFAHIISPHPPFVFGADGAAVTPQHAFTRSEPGNRHNYRAGYRDQITYLNLKLREAVAGILSQAERTPVIIIMGDHGPASKWLKVGFSAVVPMKHPAVIHERMSIFLAVLLPGEEDASHAPALYPSITPVNVMRIVLDRYFGENNGLLKDRSYFSSYGSAFKLTRVDEILDSMAVDR